MTDRDVAIGQNLARLRGEKTQQDIADAMRSRGYKWSQATVWSVEKGERPIRLTEAADLAFELRANLDELIAPPVEALIIKGLNDAMEGVQVVREKMASTVDELTDAQTRLRAVVQYVDEVRDKEWEDSSLKEKAVRLAEVGREMLSWTPESMIRGILRG